MDHSDLLQLLTGSNVVLSKATWTLQPEAKSTSSLNLFTRRGNSLLETHQETGWWLFFTIFLSWSLNSPSETQAVRLLPQDDSKSAIFWVGVLKSGQKQSICLYLFNSSNMFSSVAHIDLGGDSSNWWGKLTQKTLGDAKRSAGHRKTESSRFILWSL